MAFGAAGKIEEFLATLESEGRNPDKRESFHFLRALQALSAGLDILADADIDRAMKKQRNRNMINLRGRVLPQINDEPMKTAQLRRLWENSRKPG